MNTSSIQRKEDRTYLAREHFFEKQVNMSAWKDSMSGKNENRVVDVLENIGYKLGVDFERQYPIAQRYVLDFAFVNEQVAVEIDGENHNKKSQIKKDKIRDRYLRENNWITIRIKNSDLFGYKFSFYKNLINEIVKERREQYKAGILYEIDFTRFNREEDYE